MSGSEKDSLRPRKLAEAVSVLRGVLAEPSGSEDDPWSRVILRRTAEKAATDAAPALELNLPESEAPTETLRDPWRQAVESHAKAHGARPRRIALRGYGGMEVLKDPAADGRPLENRIAIVTGAAGAIGAGICRRLLETGCRVAATDIVKEKLDELVAEFQSPFPGRIIGVPMDVTDTATVAEGFASVCREWGGVDIVIVNAGIAAVGGLTELDVDTFRRLERVNVEGALITIAEAARWLSRQGTGGDIVLISTKNVFAPGAQFGAYSATKAAAHQLARIASLELAPFGIRVNMVAPDAVFSEGRRKSGLWAEVGPSRMQARGLDEKGLEEYYRTRNLLKARVTATHVANAVLFFATRQTPTTGATLPVDGGLPDATPR